MLQNCHLNSQLKTNCKLSRSSLVLNRSEWNKLINKTNREKQMMESAAEKENKYKVYLKQESDALNAEFKAEIKNQAEEQLRKEQERMAEVSPRFEEIKAADDKKRKELIEQAEILVLRKKPGPIQLESSAVLSEVLKTRENQVEFKVEQNKKQEERQKLDDYQTIAQAEAWIAEQSQKQLNERRVRDQYKKEIYNVMQHNRSLQTEQRKSEYNQEQVKRREIDRDVQRQIAKENDLLAKKREALRRNATEAMLVAEQRRARQKLEEEIENKVLQAYNNGKQQLNEEEKQVQAQLKISREQYKAQASNMLYHQLHSTPKHEPDQSYVGIQRDAKEQERLDRNKKIKLARIQQHIDEMEQQEKMKQLSLQDRKRSADNRQRNIEVNYQFQQRKQTDQYKKVRDARAVLDDQMAENREHFRQERAQNKQYCRINDAKEEDNQFFSYANHLMSDAVSKGRPTFPFKKTINDYKKNVCVKSLMDQHPVQPHLVSNVAVGPNFCHSTPKMVRTKKAYKYELEELKLMNPYRRCY